jgi:hypothetical protein
MQRLSALAATVAAAAVMVVPAFAASPGTDGQPSQSCLSSTALMEPGQAASAQGSAFNEPSATNPSGGIAGQVYAGNGQTTSTPANGAAVPQYDVACFQVSAASLAHAEGRPGPRTRPWAALRARSPSSTSPVLLRRPAPTPRLPSQDLSAGRGRSGHAQLPAVG